MWTTRRMRVCRSPAGWTQCCPAGGCWWRRANTWVCPATAASFSEARASIWPRPEREVRGSSEGGGAVDFGLVLQPDPPASVVVRRMREAEELGFSYGWTFDSHVLWQEPFVIYAQILSATSALTVGPMVTNPLTRDWSVTASLFATLNDTFGNRTVCGIGRGDSARRVLGKPPSSLTTLAEAMRVIKDLAEGRPANLGG